MNIAIGADIGGSHISCAAIDLYTHTLIHESYTDIAINNHAEANEIILKWGDAIQQTMQKADVRVPAGIGFAMPGPFDYLQGIGLFREVQKFYNLYGVHVEQKLQSALGFHSKVPIRFMNDATSFAVGAVWEDETLANKSVLAITLGTGFGSAFIKNSLPVLEGDTVPYLGCLYHLPYKDGIADDTFSTRGIIKSYEERSGDTAKGVKEIAEKAKTDKAAKQTFEKLGKELAGFLSVWIKKADITDIVMGGNISKAYSLFQESFERELKLSGHEVTVRISDENDLLAILGAARLCEEKYWYKIKPLLKLM